MRLKRLCYPLTILTMLLASEAWAARSLVVFLSNPPGATVTDADQGELGITPLRLNLKRKTALECTFSKPGYESRTVSLVVDALREEMRADLAPLPLTTVRLGVEPRNATVRLSAPDGTEVYSGESGRVHTLPNYFWAGARSASFQVEAWAPGYRPTAKEIVLNQHEKHELSVPLAEVSTLLSITSDPQGARVSDEFLGSLGVTPLEVRVSLAQLMRERSRQGASAGDPARLLLTFAKSGHKTAVRQVSVDFERAENAVSTSLEPITTGGN